MPECTFRFPAQFEAYPSASAQLRRELERHRLADKPRYRAELVFEEIVTNIIRHSSSRHLQCSVEVSVRVESDAVVLRFSDDGWPFDPCAYDARPLPDSIEAAGEGGLGIFLVRETAAQMVYARTREEKNELVVKIAA